jgi:hypothetical protein
MKTTITITTKAIENADAIQASESTTIKPFKATTRFTIKPQTGADLFNDVQADFGPLGQDLPVVSTTFVVTDATNIARLSARCKTAFGKIGIGFDPGDDLNLELDLIKVDITGTLTGSDMAPLSFVLHKLADRACHSVNPTTHPLTLFDLKQTVGIVYDAKQGDDDAKSILDWFNTRELAELERTKDARDAAKKAKRDAAAKDKPKPKPKTGTGTKPGTAKNSGEETAANLSSLIA